MKNILDLEINELAADAAKGVSILLGALNSLSSRFFSFFNSALLGSLNRTAEMS
jgi:hypothetical protein